MMSGFQYYVAAFRNAVEAGGLLFALRRSAAFLNVRARARLQMALRFGRSRAKVQNRLAPVIETLGVYQPDRDLVIILSNIAIKQCIYYRIQQKIDLLGKIGISAMHIDPRDTGRLRSFLPFAHSVIIYRSSVGENLMLELRKSNAKLIFEFDDLVVGTKALERSKILDQVGKNTAAGLLRQSENFLRTAKACDGIIVSTPYLADVYSCEENGLADKPCYVVPNFAENEQFAPDRDKTFTFAYTSPSGSVRDELEMLKSFLVRYDDASAEDWSILVMGNVLASQELGALVLKRGTVLSEPFLEFDSYIDRLSQTRTVLIPLADSDFNRAKTPIRLMNAAIAGAQALFCSVGAYQQIRDVLAHPEVCLSGDLWANNIDILKDLLEHDKRNVGDLQRAIIRIYGQRAALDCYRNVFINQLSVPVDGRCADSSDQAQS